MSEQNLLKMFQGILSSQSFELLSEFSNEALWLTLKEEEKEALAQLFLIHGEKTLHDASFQGDLSKARAAFEAACRLMPNSAKTWFRYGSYMSLSEMREDLEEAMRALEKSIELDARFFDAHYALGSLQLRVGSSTNDEFLLRKAHLSFSHARDLVEKDNENGLPLEFSWHWGIIHFLLGRMSGEPADFQKAILYYHTAHERGLAKADFVNDYANALVEFSLLIGKNDSIEQAAELYEKAFLYDREEGRMAHTQAIRIFNAGCCYVHLFECTLDKTYFQKAEDAFLRVLALEPLELVFQKMGQLYFLGARESLSDEYVEKSIDSFQKAHALGVEHPLMLAYYAQALLLLYEKTEKPHLLEEAEKIAARSLEAETSTHLFSAEPSLAQALCQFEKGKYFHDISLMKMALESLQKALSLYPRSAHLWYALGSIKTTLALLDQDEDQMREAVICFLFASRSIIAHYSHFWNSWGLTLLSLADITEDVLLAEEACSKFEVALELSHFTESDWIFNLGCAIDLLGCLKEEEELHEQAIELFKYIEEEDPTLYDVLLQQAVCFLHLGEARNSLADFRKAEELLIRYLREDEEDEFAWSELGLALLHQSTILQSSDETLSFSYRARAEDAFLRAVVLGNPIAYYHLACLYAFARDFPDAMECLWKAEEEGALPPIHELLEEERLMPLFFTRPFMQLLHEMTFEESLE